MPHRHGHWISSPPPLLGSREETGREDGWEQLRSLFPTWFQPRTKLAGTHRTLGLISSTAAAAYPPISTNPARRHHTARQSCAWASWPCKPQLALPDHLDPTVADVMSSPPCPPQSRVRRSLQPRPKSRIHPLFLSTSAVLLSSPCHAVIVPGTRYHRCRHHARSLALGTRPRQPRPRRHRRQRRRRH